MRVLFIYPDLSSNVTHYTGVASYSIATLSAVLKRAGHDVSLYHMISEPSEEEFRGKVRAAGPDLVGFSVNSHYACRLRKWAVWAHSEVGVPVAVGGIHATLDPEGVSSIPDVEFTCVGEGEFALLELCDALERDRDPSTVTNLWVWRNATLVKNPLRPLCHDLDQLPDPDLSVFDFSQLYPVRRGLFSYIMSRGCAFDCTYCSAPMLKSLSPGEPVWRFLSPKRAASQLSGLLARYMPEARQIQFMDAIMFRNRRWLAEFAPLYKEYVGRPFFGNLRADLVDHDIADILRDMGCIIARLGVESGDEEMTSKVLKRGLSIEDVRRAFAVLRECGIKRLSYNMVGLPGETLRLALKTVRLNADMDPELVIPFIFHPYPGTELHHLCVSNGYLSGREYDHYRIGVTTRLPGFRAPDILFVHRFFIPLMQLYGLARSWPTPLKRAWGVALDAVLTSPLLPRWLIVGARDHYKRFRHLTGEYLIWHAPGLYRLLGGTDPL